jgi:hypothetical protein
MLRPSACVAEAGGLVCDGTNIAGSRENDRDLWPERRLGWCWGRRACVWYLPFEAADFSCTASTSGGRALP